MSSRFTVGVRVAVISGYARDLAQPTEAFVTKAYKNGNFMISTKPGQHKPDKGTRSNRAYPTGQGDRARFTHVLWLWDQEFEVANRRDLEARVKAQRLMAARASVADASEEFNELELCMIEEALRLREDRLAAEAGESNDRRSNDWPNPLGGNAEDRSEIGDDQE